MDRLVCTNVKELELLFKRGQQECSTKFRVENLVHTMSVAINISTTNPPAFTIKPSSLAIIPPLSSAYFSISTTNHSDDRPPLSFPQDKLSIRSFILPTGKAEEEQLHSNFSEPDTRVYKDATLPICFIGEDTTRAIISDRTGGASILLAKAVSVCTPSQMSDLLRFAASIGKPEFISALVDVGANVNCRDAHGFSPLYVAMKSGDAASVRALLSTDAAVDPAVDRLLHSAGSLTRLDVLTAFVDFGLMDALCLGDKLLMAAWQEGNVHGMMEYVLQGASVDGRDQNGWTPMHRAAFKGSVDNIEFLLDPGARMWLRIAHLHPPSPLSKPLFSSLKTGFPNTG